MEFKLHVTPREQCNMSSHNLKVGLLIVTHKYFDSSSTISHRRSTSSCTKDYWVES